MFLFTNFLKMIKNRRLNKNIKLSVNNCVDASLEDTQAFNVSSNFQIVLSAHRNYLPYYQLEYLVSSSQAAVAVGVELFWVTKRVLRLY